VVDYTFISNPAQQRLRVPAEARGLMRGLQREALARLGFSPEQRLNASSPLAGLTA
jgi:hypothetical protein